MPSDTVMLALIATIPPTLTAITGVIIAIKNNNKAAVNSNKLDQLHVAVNSRLDQLLAAKESVARAEGNIEGKAEAKAEEKTDAFNRRRD